MERLPPSIIIFVNTFMDMVNLSHTWWWISLKKFRYFSSNAGMLTCNIIYYGALHTIKYLNYSQYTRNSIEMWIFMVRRIVRILLFIEAIAKRVEAKIYEAQCMYVHSIWISSYRDRSKEATGGMKHKNEHETQSNLSYMCVHVLVRGDLVRFTTLSALSHVYCNEMNFSGLCAL